MIDKDIFKILIADDQSILRQRLKSFILAYMDDANILETEDVPSTLALARVENPQVIILDLCMPGGGGFHTIPTLKQLQPAPVVIILTNYPYPQYRQGCLQSGADYFLDKSSEFELIPEILQKIRSERNGLSLPNQTV